MKLPLGGIAKSGGLFDRRFRQERLFYGGELVIGVQRLSICPCLQCSAMTRKKLPIGIQTFAKIRE
ncbi:MAG: hypothetical protein KIG95_09565, partial [Comamonas sp.]|nr:hypothetical protein [Comamonas sp.]